MDHGRNERREHLKQYIIGCVRDSVLSWSDLISGPDKVVRALSGDIKAVLKDLGKEGGVGLLRVGAAALAGLAEDVVGRKTKGAG